MLKIYIDYKKQNALSNIMRALFPKIKLIFKRLVSLAWLGGRNPGFNNFLKNFLFDILID
jgi:hypothetical protein